MVSSGARVGFGGGAPDFPARRTALYAMCGARAWQRRCRLNRLEAARQTSAPLAVVWRAWGGSEFA